MRAESLREVSRIAFRTGGIESTEQIPLGKTFLRLTTEYLEGIDCSQLVDCWQGISL